jgi:8-oxo-dGTP diphosphatase
MTRPPTTEGCQIILVDSAGAVLLQLRDDKDWIPYPGMWAVPGGMLEPGEAPLDCVVREVREELGVDLDPADVTFLETAQRSYGVEHTFTARLDVPAGSIALTEGQRVEWFSRERVAATRLAYEDDAVLAAFFARQA